MKLYADERGHKAVRAAAPLTCSAVARVEVPGALWRKSRLGDLSTSQATILTGEFERDYARVQGCEHPLVAISVTADLLERAAILTASQALRALDAVQLASAALARETEPLCGRFACFDAELRSAAEALGFSLIPDSA